MDRRIEEARQRAREKALEVVASGTATQRILLIMAETDRRANNRGIEQFLPLLTIEETQKLISLVREPKQWRTLERMQLHYDRIVKATSVLEEGYTKVIKNYYIALYYQVHWADIEAMETAVNIALMGVENVSQRKKLAEGIANRLDLLGCSQTYTPEGLLLISHHNPSLKEDLAAKMEKAHRNLPKLLEQYKGSVQAVLNFIDLVNLRLPATKGFINSTEKHLKKIFGTQTKYSDIPREPKVKEKYRVFPIYDELEPDKKTIRMFNNLYLLPTKDEAKS